MAYVGVKPAGITSATEAEIAGDLTVDTNTLHVDASNDRVGVGTASPAVALEIDGTSGEMLRLSSTNINQASIVARASDDTNRWRIGTLASNPNLFIEASNASGDMIFRTGGANERMRILDGGGLTFNGDTATANALDDYEEGTHTASVTCGTSGTITLTAVGDDLSYTKVGNQVNIRGMLQIDSVSSPVGNIKIDLPFTNGSGSGFSARTPFEVFILNSSSNIRDFVGILFEGDDKLVIYLGDAGNAQSDSAQSLSGDEEIYVNATYKVA